MWRRHDVRDGPTVDALQPWRIATMRERLMGLLLFVCVLAGYLFSFTVDQPAHNGDSLVSAASGG